MNGGSSDEFRGWVDGYDLQQHSFGCEFVCELEDGKDGIRSTMEHELKLLWPHAPSSQPSIKI